MRWWRRLLQRDAVERELDAELRYHFDRRIDDLMGEGLGPREARRAARLEFGGLDQIKERCRDARGTRWLEDLLADARYAVRLLRKDRAFAAVAIAALGVGIAVNNTQFSIVDGYCLRGLPIERPDRVAFVGTRDRQHGNARMSYADFLDVRLAGVFGELAAAATAPVSLGGGDQAAEGALAAYVSTSTLHLLGRAPAVGRDLRDEDARPGAPLAVLLSNRVWRSRYDADPRIPGRAVRISGAPGVIVGVLPDGFTFPDHADLWIPLEQMPGVRAAPRDARTLSVFARLREGTTLGQAQAELDALGVRLAAEYPETNAGIAPAAEAINAHYNGRITDPAWMAFTIVGILVVVIACANVANLMLMRSAVRARDVAMRTALGATRMRIVRQLLVESAMLAIAGGVLGLALSAVALKLFLLAVPAAAIPYGGLWVNGRVLAVLSAVTMGTVLLFGLVPALGAVPADVSGALKTGTLSVTHDARVRRWTTGFLTIEFGLMVLLVSGVGLTLQSFRAARGASEKIDRAHLLVLRLALPPEHYATLAQRADLYDRLKARLAAAGGVSGVSFMSNLPLGGATPRQVEREGESLPAGERRPVVWTVAIDPAYLSTLGLGIVRGRAFEGDSARAGEALVNERLAQSLLSGRDPVGQRIRLAADPQGLTSAPWLTIVGVMPNIRQNPPVLPDPIVYLPFAGSQPARPAVIIRTRDDPAALAPLVREQVRGLDPDLPIVALQTARQAEREAGWNGRISQNIIMTIALIAVALAAVGLYAVTAYGVARRTREIGIRVALGARRRRVIWMVMRGALVQVFLGFWAGLLLKAAWAHTFATASGGGVDPFNVVSTMVVLAGVAIAASIAPALRALSINPLEALRAE
jgi:putative ABC transport system permease protein